MADDNENEFEEEFDFESEEDLLESADDEFGETDAYGASESKMPPLPALIGGGAAGLVLIIAIAYFAFGGEEEVIPPSPEPIVEIAPEPEPVKEPDPWGSNDGGDLLANDKPAITPKTVVEKIEAQEKNLNTKIQALEIKLNELLSKLGRLDSAMSVSSRDITDVNLKLEAINQELKMIAAPPAPTVKEEKVESLSEAYTNPTFTVHAIIPGRAWLKTRDGKTITVTEGDAIDGYGKVMGIDAPSGVVLTSSGVMLR